MYVVVQVASQVRHGGSLISTPSCLDRNICRTSRHTSPWYWCSHSRVGSFIDSGFWSENAALECRIYTLMFPPKCMWSFVLASVRDEAEIYDDNMVVFYRF